MNIKIKYKFKMNIKIEFPFKKLKKMLEINYFFIFTQIRLYVRNHSSK